MIHVTNDVLLSTPPYDSYDPQVRADDLLSCHRCKGLLAKEVCFDLEDETGENWFWALRCLQCGDIVDPVIVQNRHAKNPSNIKNRSRRKAPIRTSNF